MKRETGKDEQEVREGFLDQGFSSYPLYLFWLFTAGLSLPPFYPPSICQTDSCWLTPSVVVHSVPDSTQAPPFLCLLPNMLLYFTSLLSLPSSSLQFTRSESYRGPGSGFHENVRDASVQFVLLPLLLAVFLFELPQIRLEMYNEPERSRE